MVFIDQCIEVEMTEKLHQVFVEQAVGHLLKDGWQLKRGTDLDTNDEMSNFENANQQGTSGAFKSVCLVPELWKL